MDSDLVFIEQKDWDAVTERLKSLTAKFVNADNILLLLFARIGRLLLDGKKDEHFDEIANVIKSWEDQITLFQPDDVPSLLGFVYMLYKIKDDEVDVLEVIWNLVVEYDKNKNDYDGEYQDELIMLLLSYYDEEQDDEFGNEFFERTGHNFDYVPRGDDPLVRKILRGKL